MSARKRSCAQRCRSNTPPLRRRCLQSKGTCVPLAYPTRHYTGTAADNSAQPHADATATTSVTRRGTIPAQRMITVATRWLKREAPLLQSLASSDATLDQYRGNPPVSAVLARKRSRSRKMRYSSELLPLVRSCSGDTLYRCHGYPATKWGTQYNNTGCKQWCTVSAQRRTIAATRLLKASHNLERTQVIVSTMTPHRQPSPA